MPPPLGELGLQAVIAAPLLWPLAALLQLLFPALLRDRLRAYRWPVAMLLTQATLLTLGWLLGRFWPSAGWGAHVGSLPSLLAVGAVCAVLCWLTPPAALGRPHKAEWVAFAVLLLAFGGRAAWAGRPFVLGHGTALALASAAALLHLVLRQRDIGLPALTTPRIFLTAYCAVAAAGVLSRPGAVAGGEPAYPVEGEWLTVGGNPQRTGTLDAADPGPTEPRVLWRFRCPAGGRFDAAPVRAGGEVWAVATVPDSEGVRLTGRLYRLDAASGRLLQAIELPRGGVSSPALGGPWLAVGEGYHQDAHCRLHVFDRRTGRPAGTVATASHVESSPALDGRRVVFGAGEDGTHAAELDAEGPQPLWHVAGDHVDAAPLLAAGLAVVGSVPGRQTRPPALFALDAATGGERWRVPTPLPVLTAPASADGRVVATLGNGTLDRDAERPAGAVWCLDLATGQRLWQVPAAASFYGSPAVVGEQVFVVAGDGLCQCLHRDDGQRRWQTPLGRRVAASPVVSGGAVFVLARSGLLVKLDAAGGRILWQFDELEEYAPRGDLFAAPLLAEGRLFGTVGKYVVCVGDRRE